MNSGKEGFSELNFGTKPTSVRMEKVEVAVNLDEMVGDFGRAYAKELNRRNPVRYQTSGLSEDELSDYFKNLIAMRIASVNDKFPEWRVAKALLLTAWLEYTMTCVGEVIDSDRGLDIIPVCSEQYDMTKALETSAKLRVFKADGLVLLQDAFPRTKEGDVDTMSMAVIGDYVYSQNKEAHPIASYVAAYLGFKLKEEAAFKMLYRVRYDDIDYIHTMLLNEESVIE